MGRRARAAQLAGALGGRAVIAGRWDATAPAAAPRDAPGGVQRAIDLAGHALAQWMSDLAAIVSAHACGPGESRRAAWRRGRAAAGFTRGLREEAMWATTPGTEPAARRRLAAAAAVVGLGLVACAVVAGVAVTSAVGDAIPGASPLFGLGGYLAGLFDGLGEWWADLGVGGQLAVGAAFAALVVLSGGSLGLGFGLSGVATYGLGKGEGIATFARDPAVATRAYLATATPQGILLDAGEALLTFAPSNFAGAVAGRSVRNAVAEYAADPGTFWAVRRAAMRGESGVVDPGAFVRREPIELADGIMLPRLSDAELPEMSAYAAGRRVRQVEETRPDAAAYQRRIYGDDEPLLAEQPETWADGWTVDYGAVGDAKLVTKARSWYDPGSLGDDFLAERARRSWTSGSSSTRR